jgi:kynureninase
MNSEEQSAYTNLNPETALALDLADELQSFRTQFHLPPKPDGTPQIYFCGNSLGLQPRKTHTYVEQELEDWARLGVEGHFHARHPWMPYHEFLTEQTARLVGALPSEVVNMNHLTVNLHLLMVSFYRPVKGRSAILIEKGAFPSDRYAVESQIRFHGYNPETELLELAPRAGEICLRQEDILDYISKHGDKIALVLMGGVNYYTGQLFPLQKITEAGHAKGMMVGFDLAHAAGNALLELHNWEVDFAAWCTYKYLNGGPGGVGGVFIHQKHHTRTDLPRFAGWWGQNKESRFRMGPEFDPIPTAEGWQLSNAPVLSMAALRASLEIFDQAGMTSLRNKSRLMTSYLEYLIQERNKTSEKKVEIITPSDPEARGAQLSLRAGGTEGKKVFDQLLAAGIIADWRYPDVIRVAPTPLYNTFQEVYRFSELLFLFL